MKQLYLKKITSLRCKGQVLTLHKNFKLTVTDQTNDVATVSVGFGVSETFTKSFLTKIATPI